MLILFWAIPIAAFVAAFAVMAKEAVRSAGKGSAGPTPDLLVPGLANVSKVCHKFRVRELWLIGAMSSRVGDEKELELLVEFEPDAKVDYPAFLRLQADLSAIAGRPARLVHKRADWHAAPAVTGPEARLLYAAAA